jgi:hypothetical protein
MSSFASSISKVFYGTFIHSISIKEIEFISNGLLFVDTHGRIAKIVRNVPNDQFRGALDGAVESKVLSSFLTLRWTLVKYRVPEDTARGCQSIRLALSQLQQLTSLTLFMFPGGYFERRPVCYSRLR